MKMARSGKGISYAQLATTDDVQDRVGSQIASRFAIFDRARLVKIFATYDDCRTTEIARRKSTNDANNIVRERVLNLTSGNCKP